ncbi:bifunctional UDP-N-acetylmuramoyl-tripeptide:D-alanyl-D-alanine ligase/alanine racemase [Bacteroidia bacterium]|nr:bifunctional UDP-N-acetylmuramoyl-tripeptide:D-alanyl-D-alanine ligase/alanine racemase [Bacteroidia bacterium]
MKLTDYTKDISIDSRLVSQSADVLFFAFKGKNHNGHDYVTELYHKGVRSFFVSERREEYGALEGADIQYVDNVLEALQVYATKKREAVKAEIIAITGSNGKTSVKEWLYQSLVDDFSVYRSPKSYNSQIGVPLSLCGIEDGTQIAIIEAGISEKSEMEVLERMIKPDIAIFTHFGDAHSENFASEEEKLNEKAILFRNAKVIVGRQSDELEFIRATAHQYTKSGRCVSWGDAGDDKRTSANASAHTHVNADEDANAGDNIGANADNNIYVTVKTLEIGHNARKVSVRYKNKEKNTNKNKETEQDTEFILIVPFADEASFENCMNVVCVLLLKNIPPDVIVKRVATLQPIAMRLEIKEGIGKSVLVNDFYNSDVTSFSLALNVLQMQDDTKEKLVILSDFISLKADRSVLYSKVAEMLASATIKHFIGIGEEINAFKSVFAPHSRFYRTTEDFLLHEKRTDYANKAVLLKGARKFRFEAISNFLQLQTHNTVLEVYMDVMVANLNYFRSLIPEHTKIAVMAKALFYGSGGGEVANLLQYHGVDYLMVAFADEGIALRAAGITIPIAVMNPEADVFDKLLEYELEPEIYSLELLEQFEAVVLHYGRETFPVHLKLNTGMNRSGFDDLTGIIDFFKTKRRIEVLSVFSHLAASDERQYDDFTLKQIANFEHMTAELQHHIGYSFMRHILNSSGIEHFPNYAFDMVRLGIGLYGVSTDSSISHAKLSPVSSFKTYIMSVRKVGMSETVGYGRKGRLQRDSQIAVVPVGYADGLDRRLGNGIGKMFVKGQKVPIIGNICMDTCMLDITNTNIQTGDEVEIFGKNILVTEVAEQLNTIPYEVLTGVSARVKRVYFKE